MRSIEDEEGDDVRMMRWDGFLQRYLDPFVSKCLPANFTVMLYKEHVNERHLHITTIPTIRHPSKPISSPTLRLRKYMQYLAMAGPYPRSGPRTLIEAWQASLADSRNIGPNKDFSALESGK
jgi:hypothetical protein